MPLAAATPTLYGSSSYPWRFVLATYGGTNLAEVTNTRDRALHYRLNSASTIEFTMDLSHTHMPELLANRHGLLKAYKRGSLLGVYEIATGQLGGSSDEHSIKVVGTDPGHARLEKRFVGKTPAGLVYLHTDRGSIVTNALATINAENDTKIRMGYVAPTSTESGGPWYYKGALELLQELGLGLNGYDYWFTPADPTIAPGGIVSWLNIAPLRGGVREQAVFEYGTGRYNVRDYGYLWNTTERISRAISLPSDYPNNAAVPVLTSNDTATQTAIGLREAVIDSDLVDRVLRQGLIDDHVRIRKNARNIFTINPHIADNTERVPAFGIDYGIGDQINFRVRDSGLVVFEGWVRVYGADIELDNGGGETVTLTVVDEA